MHDEFEFNINDAFSSPLWEGRTVRHIFGAILGGLGKLAFGTAGTAATATTAATAGTPGLFGAGGSFSLAQAGPTALGIGSALGGGASVGSAPSMRIKLTKRGRKLEEKLYKSVTEEIFPENLAAKYIGQAKKIETARQGVATGAFSRSYGRETSGGMLKGIMPEMQSRMRGDIEGAVGTGEMRQQFARSRMGNLQNIMALDKQAPIMRAQGSLINQEMAQMRGAAQGAGLGNLAQLLAVTKYPINRGY